MTKREKLLESLLRRAWKRLGECVCHGEEGSVDHAEQAALMDEIDAALPMEREDRINACQHDEDDGRCLCCEADAEYMVPPQWVRD